MFPFCDSPSPMDLPLYQQLQLSPPSPKPDPDHHQSSFFYYHSSPAFAGADAFNNSCYLDAGAATLPSSEIDCSPPPELLLMDQAPAAPHAAAGNNAQQGDHHCSGGGGLDSRAAAAAAARKDRHSKICTAGGMRDRRMRLSLDVARKFFALQDMLGFDKASKTVQWLLNTSKSAIREVMTTDEQANSSECEEDDGSSISLSVAAADGKHGPTPPEKKGDRGEGKKPATGRARRAATAANPKPSRKSGANAHTIPDKESRTKARERARERTKEKNRMRWVTLASTINLESARDEELIMTNPNNLNRSSSSSMNTAVSAKLEDRCSSSTFHTTNGGRTMREMSTASHAIMAGAFGNGGIYGGGSSSSNYYYYYQHQQLEEQQWELGGVVFANSRLY